MRAWWMSFTSAKRCRCLHLSAARPHTAALSTPHLPPSFTAIHYRVRPSFRLLIRSSTSAGTTAPASFSAPNSATTPSPSPSSSSQLYASSPPATPASAPEAPSSPLPPPPPPTPLSTASSPACPPSSSSPPSPVRGVDVLLGFLLGVVLYYSVEWLRYWPEPLPLIRQVAEADPLVQAELSGGGRLRCSPFWTGNVREGSSASVALPVSGAKGSGELHARLVFHAQSRQWRFVYLQAALQGKSQRHSLSVPAQYALPPMYPSSSSAAGTDPTLFPPSPSSLLTPPQLQPTPLTQPARQQP